MEHEDETAAAPEAQLPESVDAADRASDHTASDEASDEDAEGLDDLPQPPDTGDETVDEATADLARAMREPLELQVQAYERAHRTLQDRLADVES